MTVISLTCGQNETFEDIIYFSDILHTKQLTTDHSRSFFFFFLQFNQIKYLAAAIIIIHAILAFYLHLLKHINGNISVKPVSGLSSYSRTCCGLSVDVTPCRTETPTKNTGVT